MKLVGMCVCVYVLPFCITVQRNVGTSTGFIGLRSLSQCDYKHTV